MAEVKWIKISTAMFDDEKIDFIESLPEADAILIVWIKLLTLAGKCNAGGYIFLTETIPYTEEMLAHKFRRPLNIVKLALGILEKLGMIKWDDGRLYIKNWVKYQNVDGLEKIREQTRQRVANYRKRHAGNVTCNVTRNVTVTPCNAIEEDKDIEQDTEQDKDTITAAVYNEFSQNIHPITPMEMQYIDDWLQEMPAEVIIEAIKEAVANNVRKWSYINGILNNWKALGWKSLEAVQAGRRDRADQAAQKKQKVKEQEQPAGMTGEEAWLEVMLRIKNGGGGEWSHPAIKDALVSVGGLRAVGDCDPGSLPYLKSQFVKAFEVLSKRRESDD